MYVRFNFFFYRYTTVEMRKTVGFKYLKQEKKKTRKSIISLEIRNGKLRRVILRHYNHYFIDLLYVKL